MPAPPTIGASLQERTFERVLLIKPSSLGDVVHALPVLHALRRRYPHAGIDWLVATPFASLLEGHPDISEVILFDRKRFARLARSLRVVREFLRFVGRLRARRYDLVIDLQGLFRSGFLAAASGAPVRIGFADAREGARMFYTHRLPPAPPDTHAVDRNYRVGELLGFADSPVEFPLPIPAAVRDEASALLRQVGLGAGEPYIAVAPAARWETKVWAGERFAAAIDALQESRSTRCVLLGSPAEAETCRRISEACRTRPINVAGRTDVRLLAALLERAAVVLCHDSAALHLAVAFGRPLVCLIGPTNPRRTGPYRRLEDVVRLELDCSPCYFRRLRQCPHDHRCMRDLSTERVVAAVQRSLDRAERAVGPTPA